MLGTAISYKLVPAPHEDLLEVSEVMRSDAKNSQCDLLAAQSRALCMSANGELFFVEKLVATGDGLFVKVAIPGDRPVTYWHSLLTCGQPGETTERTAHVIGFYGFVDYFDAYRIISDESAQEAVFAFTRA